MTPRQTQTVCSPYPFIFSFITKLPELECFPLSPTPISFYPENPFPAENSFLCPCLRIISYLHQSPSPSGTELLPSSQWLFQPVFDFSAQALCLKHTLCISLQHSGQLRTAFCSAVPFTVFSSVFKPGILHPYLSSAQPRPEPSRRRTVPSPSTSHHITSYHIAL